MNENNRDELLRNLSTLKTGFIKLINDIDVLVNWGKVQLEALYATKIGRFKVKLLEMQIEYKVTTKKIQLAFQAINKGEKPDFFQIENEVNLLLGEAQQEIELEQMKVEAGTRLLKNLEKPERAAELRRLYRVMAKSLHPDVNINLSEKQKEAWYLIQDAYKKGDLERLAALQVAFDEEIKQSEDIREMTTEDLLLRIATLKQGIIELEREKKEIEEEFPFTIADKIRDETWVENQKKIIQKQVQELKPHLKAKQEEYLKLKDNYGG